MSEYIPIPAPHLAIELGGHPVCVELENDSTVLIGSGGHCRIQLEGDGIRSLHCIVAIKEDGRVEIRDWNTGCTFVNGTAIGENVVLNDGDQIGIANHEIKVVFPGPVSLAAATDIADGAANDDRQTEVAEDSEAEASAPSQTQDPVQEAPVETPEPNSEPDADSLYDSVEETAPSIPEKFVYDAGSSAEPQYDSAETGFSSGFNQQEEIQRLQMENEQLRFELGQGSSKDENSEDVLDHNGAARMVSRMGELLEELKQSDERTKELEDLLQTADQATRDEREERILLEGVISEYESRVEERQSRADSELHAMKQKLEQEWQQRGEELEKDSSAPVEMLVTMKGQIELLLEKLTVSQGEVVSLQEQLQQKETRLEEVQAELEQSQAVSSESDDPERKTLAELQVELARERAEIARERAEVEGLKMEHENQMETRETTEADNRIQAMRDHLREIHDKEKVEKANQLDDPEQNSGSIASRISSLLQQVTND